MASGYFYRKPAGLGAPAKLHVLSAYNLNQTLSLRPQALAAFICGWRGTRRSAQAGWGCRDSSHTLDGKRPEDHGVVKAHYRSRTSVGAACTVAEGQSSVKDSHPNRNVPIPEYGEMHVEPESSRTLSDQPAIWPQLTYLRV